MEAIQTDTDITLEHATVVEKNIQHNINGYYNNREDIELRLVELDNEWDTDRVLALSSSAISLTGLLLSATHNKKWLYLPVAFSGFLLSHAIAGWCPPLPLLKALGFRNRAEIDKEKFALKALRGDFKDMIEVPNSVWNAVNK